MSDLNALRKNDLIALLGEMKKQQDEWKQEAEKHMATLNAENKKLADEMAALRLDQEDRDSTHSAFPTNNAGNITPPVINTPPAPISAPPLPSPWLTNVSKTKDAKDVKKLPWLESLSLAHLEEFLFHCVGVRDIERLDMISTIKYPVLQELGVTLGNAVHNNTVLYAYLKELALKILVC